MSLRFASRQTIALQNTLREAERIRKQFYNLYKFSARPLFLKYNTQVDRLNAYLDPPSLCIVDMCPGSIILSRKKVFISQTSTMNTIVRFPSLKVHHRNELLYQTHVFRHHPNNPNQNSKSGPKYLELFDPLKTHEIVELHAPSSKIKTRLWGSPETWTTDS